MRYAYLLLILLGVAASRPAIASSTSRTLETLKANPVLRVLLLETSTSLNLQAGGSFRISSLADKKAATTGAEIPEVTIEPGQPLEGGLKLPVQLVPTGESTISVSTKGQRSRETKARLEVLEVQGSLQVIAEIPMEEYLGGVVPFEIGSDAPPQAKCAQAVAARSFAMLSLVRSQHPQAPFDICSEICCQVYGGLEKVSPEVDKAVSSTKGQVLTFEGEPIPSYYAGNCGGWTEDIRVAWPGRNNQRAYHGAARFDGPIPPKYDLTKENEMRDWLTTSPACYCNIDHFKVPAWASRNLRWKREFAAEDVTTMVAQRKDIGRITAIRPGERGFSGRLKSAEFVGEKGTLTASPEYDVRRVFDPYLRSGAFVVDTRGPADKPTHFILTGAGGGHGVGMCQTGAMGMASVGKDFAEILKHYYPNATLRKMY